MVESRWLRWFGPGVAALVAVGFVASTTLGAGDRPWSPRPCAAVAGALVVALGPPVPAEAEDLRTEVWFRLDPVLDDDGALRAQRLVTGLAGWRGRLAAELPPESFAAGPFGRIVLVGSDDGTRSRLDAYDVERGCAFPIATATDVVRRATIDPDGGTLYETRVARSDRADLGVWARPLGAAAATRVLEPMPADDRFGRTFATEFTWDAAGDRLAVQTCGETACRIRIVRSGGGAVETIADPEVGRLIGFDRDRLVAYGACRGMPCPIISIDRAGGPPSIVDPLGGRAAVVWTVDGARLVRVARDDNGRRLRTTGLDGSDAHDAGSIPDGHAPVPPAPDPGGGSRVPPGWIVLAPDGRLADDPTVVRSELRRIADGTSVPLDEVLR